MQIVVCSGARTGDGCPLCASPLIQSSVPLCIWMTGFLLLDSPLFPRQPPLHLFSAHWHLTLRAFCHRSLLIPLEKMLQPRPASSQRPLGHGTIKNKQELSGAVMLILIRDLASIAAEVVGEFGIEAQKNPNILCLLNLRSIFTVV